MLDKGCSPVLHYLRVRPVEFIKPASAAWEQKVRLHQGSSKSIAAAAAAEPVNMQTLTTCGL